LYKFLKLAVSLGFIAVLSTGCVNHSTANVNPLVNLSSLKTMHVKHLPSDNTKVNEEIADKLRLKGVTVSTGATPPSNVDAIVTYIDRWRWDITMYMLELTVTIRDPKSDWPMAVGNSLHTSLTRKSQSEMIDEVINTIYNNAGKPPAATNGPTTSAASTTSPVTPQQITPPTPAIKEAAATPPASNLSEKLRELDALKKDGLITEAEYASKRKMLIEKF
jgi:hypothetical protein